MVRKHIMIIASDGAVVRQVGAVAAQLGFDVSVMYDGLDALVRATRKKPDLIVFDADVAAVGALNLADIIARDRRFQPVQMIAIVAETDQLALWKYTSRGVTVARKGAAGVEGLRLELISLLKPHASRFFKRKNCRHVAHTEAAE